MEFMDSNNYIQQKRNNFVINSSMQGVINASNENYGTSNLTSNTVPVVDGVIANQSHQNGWLSKRTIMSQTNNAYQINDSSFINEGKNTSVLSDNIN